MSEEQLTRIQDMAQRRGLRVVIENDSYALEPEDETAVGYVAASLDELEAALATGEAGATIKDMKEGTAPTG